MPSPVSCFFTLFPYILCCVCPLLSVDLCMHRLLCWTFASYPCLLLCPGRLDEELYSWPFACCPLAPRPVGCAHEVVSTACVRKCLYGLLWSSHTSIVACVCHCTLDIVYSLECLLNCCTNPLLLHKLSLCSLIESTDQSWTQQRKQTFTEFSGSNSQVPFWEGGRRKSPPLNVLSLSCHSS